MRLRSTKHPARTYLGLFCIVAIVSMAACASFSGSALIDGELFNPVGPNIPFSFSAGTPKTAQAGPGLPAGKCLKTTWRGADGAEVDGSPTYAPIDDSGTASAQVPAGAVSHQTTVTDCPPDPEPEPEPDPEPTPKPEPEPLPKNGRSLAFAQSPVLQGQVGAPLYQRQSLTARDYFVFGGPVTPELTPGARNVSYSFVIRAFSEEQAQQQADALLAQGIGAVVPHNVEVVTYVETDVTVTGARVRYANPHGIDHWRLDFNDGAHIADYSSGWEVLTYQSGEWQVVETFVSVADFDVPTLLGQTFDNEVEMEFSSLKRAEIGVDRYAITGTLD